MVRVIDLNADVGEDCGDDAALLRIVTSANVATGAHAGGADILDQTVRAAVAAGCAIGAHPSYRDRERFGRVSLANEIASEDLVDDLVDQILDVAASCTRHGAHLSHVKAHGALYNDASTDAAVGAALVAAVATVAVRLGDTGIAVVGLAGSGLAAAAASARIPFLSEGFADRAYLDSGALLPRTSAGAVLTDTGQICQQAVTIAERRPLRTSEGGLLVLEADTICLHGDTPGAVQHAREVRRTLEDRGIAVAAPVRHA